MNKYVTAFLLLAILFLLWEWQCNSPKATTTDKYTDSIASLTKLIEQSKASSKLTQAIDKRKIDSMVAINGTLISRLKASTSDFEKEGRKAVEFNRLYKIARANKNTVERFNNCDSMSEKVDDAEMKYAVVKVQNDSLITEIHIAKDTYERGVTNLQSDYDSLQFRTERKDVLTVAQNIATIKKEKKKGFWLFMKGTLVGIILDEIKHLFVK